MKLSEIHINPNNPRIIKDDRFKKLVKSISEFPKMMELRPIIVDADGMILGGNMRFKALQELKYKDIPNDWVKRADRLTDEEKRRFIIEDNVPFGEWEWDILANEWDEDQLSEWGLDIESKEEIKKTTVNIAPYEMTHILISYPPELHQKVTDAINLLLDDPDIEIERSSN
ncbi:MAG TPA: ParB N-terminal domain-containing protein [Chryseolinea sp.]|nr:ParB N-terminal domain-containing protein [Chryseolinea sp.]